MGFNVGLIPVGGNARWGSEPGGPAGGLSPWPEQHLLMAAGVSLHPQLASHGLPQLPAGAHQLPCLEQGPDP